MYYKWHTLLMTSALAVVLVKQNVQYLPSVQEMTNMLSMVMLAQIADLAPEHAHLVHLFKVNYHFT